MQKQTDNINVLDNKIYNINEISNLFNCSSQTIAKLFKAEELKGNKIKRIWYTTGKNLKEYLKE